MYTQMKRTPLDRLTKGKAVLIGDACHPMLLSKARSRPNSFRFLPMLFDTKAHADCILTMRPPHSPRSRSFLLHRGRGCSRDPPRRPPSFRVSFQSTVGDSLETPRDIPVSSPTPCLRHADPDRPSSSRAGRRSRAGQKSRRNPEVLPRTVAPEGCSPAF